MDDTASSCRNVLIGNDHPPMREAIKLLISGTAPDVSFSEVGDGDALFLAAQRSSAVDLALVDVQLPNLHGGLRLFELARQYPQLPIVAISAPGWADTVARLMSIPTVCACIPKTASASLMRSAIQAALLGRKLADVQSVIEGCSAIRPPRIELTPRQLEIRGLLRQGMRNKAIAHVLGISEGTVKNHVTVILRALDATNRVQAAQLAAPQKGTDLFFGA